MAAFCVAFFATTGVSWLVFAVLVLSPDLAMLGYLVGPRAGALAYNLVHVLFWPLALIAYGFWRPDQLLIAVGWVWLFHIAVDRALGYGLKLPTAFRDTHLDRIGHD